MALVTETSIRRTITLDKRSLEHIAFLREHTDAASDSEVVRQALLYHEFFVDEFVQGTTIIARDAHGRELVLPTYTNEERREAGNEDFKRSIQLPERSIGRISRLREAIGLKSDSELIRQAVAFYAGLVATTLDGDRIILRKKDGTEIQPAIMVSSLERPKPKIKFGLLRFITP